MIKLSALVLVAFALSGCGTYAAISSCKNGSECVAYALVTEGKANGLAATVAGSAGACKVSIFGDVSEWHVVYRGEKCSAELNGDR